MTLKTYDKKIHLVGGKAYARGNHIYSHGRQVCVEFDSDFGLSYDLTAKNKLKQAQEVVDKLPALCYPSELREQGWNVPDDCIKLEQAAITCAMGRQVGKTGMVTRRLEKLYGIT